MRFGKGTVLAAVITLAVIILNGAVFYSVYCSGDVLQSKDIYGNVYQANRSGIAAQQSLIDSLTGDKDEDAAYLENNISLLEDYLAAAEYMAGNTNSLNNIDGDTTDDRKERAKELYAQYTSNMQIPEPVAVSQQISAEIEKHQAVLSRVGYALNYDSYIDDTISNAQSLTDIGIYKQNGYLQSNILKTQKDFYGLRGLEVSVVSDEGSIALVNCRFTDVFAIFLTALILVFVFFYDKSDSQSSLYRKKPMIVPVCAIAAGVAAMHTSNIIIMNRNAGVADFGVNIQSISAFRSCPYIISFGAFIVSSVAMKIIGCLILFALSAAVITARGKKRIVIGCATGVFIAAEIITAFISSVNPLLTFLREINIFSLFSFERFYIRYLNLNIASLAVSRLPVFIGFAGLIAFSSFALARKNIRESAQALASEIERGYYDEINRCYTESRKIRHDISNHLLAIRALIESGNITEARRYLNEVSEMNDLAAMPVRTGASVLDALLFKKTEQAKDSDIALTFDVSCPLGDTAISDYDLCSVFGNIIDNALEAVMPLEQNRKIAVIIEKQLDMLYIRCTNPYSGELRARGERLLTSKADTALHGYGLSRVREISAKHGGEVKITSDNGEFSIEILMNM